MWRFTLFDIYFCGAWHIKHWLTDWWVFCFFEAGHCTSSRLFDHFRTFIRCACEWYLIRRQIGHSFYDWIECRCNLVCILCNMLLAKQCLQFTSSHHIQSKFPIGLGDLVALINLSTGRICSLSTIFKTINFNWSMCRAQFENLSLQCMQQISNRTSAEILLT